MTHRHCQTKAPDNVYDLGGPTVPAQVRLHQGRLPLDWFPCKEGSIQTNWLLMVALQANYPDGYIK